jgi:hypothetical protein
MTRHLAPLLGGLFLGALIPAAIAFTVVVVAVDLLASLVTYVADEVHHERIDHPHPKEKP